MAERLTTGTQMVPVRRRSRRRRTRNPALPIGPQTAAGSRVGSSRQAFANINPLTSSAAGGVAASMHLSNVPLNDAIAFVTWTLKNEYAKNLPTF